MRGRAGGRGGAGVRGRPPPSLPKQSERERQTRLSREEETRGRSRARGGGTRPPSGSESEKGAGGGGGGWKSRAREARGARVVRAGPHSDRALRTGARASAHARPRSSVRAQAGRGNARSRFYFDPETPRGCVRVRRVSIEESADVSATSTPRSWRHRGKCRGGTCAIKPAGPDDLRSSPSPCASSFEERRDHAWLWIGCDRVRNNINTLEPSSCLPTRLGTAAYMHPVAAAAFFRPRP